MQKTTDELQLGDIIQTISLDGKTISYGCCTVKQITETAVHLVRPYIHTSEFSTTNGLIVYTGMEQYSVLRNSILQVELVERRSTPVK